MTGGWHRQRGFANVLLGRLQVAWLPRHAARGWSYLGREGGCWLLRFGPLLVAWGCR
jgi:hypothetical protein